MKYTLTLPSPIGPLRLAEENGSLIELTFGTAEAEKPSAFLLHCAHEIQEYFEGKRTCFDLPLSPIGTDFQKSVWNELYRIPYGETRTYGEIAAAVGSPKASRAVGMACNRNPIAIIIPCHRVIGKDKSLTGYAGGLSAKETLLHLERINL